MTGGRGARPPFFAPGRTARRLCLPRTKVREKAFPRTKVGKRLSFQKLPVQKEESFASPSPSARAARNGRDGGFLPTGFASFPRAPLSPPKPAPSGPTEAFSGPGRGGIPPGRSRGGQRPTGAQPGFSRPQGVQRHRRHPRHREGYRTPPPTGGRYCGDSQAHSLVLQAEPPLLHQLFQHLGGELRPGVLVESLGEVRRCPPL